MRLRKVKYAMAKISSYPELMILDPENHRGSWQSLFQKSQPIHLEIGIGKGKFIHELAQSHPEINFIGIEKYDSVIVRALERLIDSPLPNVILIYGDAEKITSYFEKGEINHLYLNFSDPWPKNSHKKRRLTHPLFLERYQSILSKDGLVEFKTDNFGLFEYTMMTLVESNAIFHELSLNLHQQTDKEIVMTEFETKFTQMGFPIYYISFQLKES
mgnify:CR=1 FL=1